MSQSTLVDFWTKSLTWWNRIGWTECCFSAERSFFLVCFHVALFSILFVFSFSSLPSFTISVIYFIHSAYRKEGIVGLTQQSTACGLGSHEIFPDQRLSRRVLFQQRPEIGVCDIVKRHSFYLELWKNIISICIVQCAVNLWFVCDKLVLIPVDDSLLLEKWNWNGIRMFRRVLTLCSEGQTIDWSLIIVCVRGLVFNGKRSFRDLPQKMENFPQFGLIIESLLFFFSIARMNRRSVHWSVSL